MNTEDRQQNSETGRAGAARLPVDGNGDAVSWRYGNGIEASGQWQESHFQYYLGVVYRRRWIVITALLVVLTFAINRNFTAVPTYEASVRLLVESEKLNLGVQDVVDQQRSLDAELAILRSRWLAAKTIQSLGLLSANADTVPPPKADETVGWWPTTKLWILRAFGEAMPPPLSIPLAEEMPAETPQINAFLSGLSFSLTANGVLDVKYESQDPVLAARFANAHAREYISQNREMRVAAVKDVSDWLAARLVEQKQKLDASEQALLRFQEHNGLITSEGSPLVVARLNELSAASTSAQTATFEKEALYKKALALRANPEELSQLPQALNSNALQQLRGELDRLRRERAQLARSLRDSHPDMVRVSEAIQSTQAKIDLEQSRVIQGMRDDLDVSRAAEARATKEIEGMKLEATVQSRKNVEISILTREVSSNRQIYDMLMQRAREAGVAKEINPSRIRVLDPAVVPGSPVQPNKGRNILAAVFAGLALGFVLAVGAEYLDNRIKSPDEITQRLGLPLLGLLPEVKVNGQVRGPLTTNGVPQEFSEELRRIRTNVLFSLAGPGLRSIAIASASPSEGKTVVSSNLAIALAQAGERVLLIDADMRRPTMHVLFDVEREPGLSNLLVRSTKASVAVRRSSVPNLWVLPAGRHPPNASELLGSAEFKKFLTAVADHFDWVLIDTPPVLAVADACVIAHQVSGIVFVVGAEMVSRQAAWRAIDQLAMANAKVLGGVLSRVEIDRYGSYYSPYYQGHRKKYRDYYRETPPVEVESSKSDHSLV